MGCSGSAAVEPEVPAEPEDPMVALLQQIHEEQEKLKASMPVLAGEQNESRYLRNTLMKVSRHLKDIAERRSDEDALFKALLQHIAQQDAYDLREASVGFGTDESKMAKVIVGRLKENLEITDTIYQDKYKRTIEDQIRGENKSLLGLLTGSLTHFGRFLVYRSMGPAARDAFLIHKCMSGVGCSDYILIEILSTRPNEELKQAAIIYAQENDGESMVERIQKETGGFGKKWYGKWIDSLVEFDRDESEDVVGDPNELAQQLYDAGEGKFMGCDEQVFIDVLNKANEPTCLAIAAAYEEAFGTELARAVEKKMGGDLEFACLARVRSKPEFYALRLFKACKGWGTDEECIGRVLGCLHKKDILDVEREYEKMYAEEEEPYNSLSNLLAAEVSGSFLEGLLGCLTSTPPKGHMRDQWIYPIEATFAADDFAPKTKEAYNPEVAKQLGSGGMDGHLTVIGMPAETLWEQQERWVEEYDQMDEVWVDQDRSDCFPDDPTEVDPAKELLTKLKDENGSIETQIESTRQVVMGLADSRYSERLHEMRYEEHYCNQIIDDNIAMVEFCASRDADYVHEATEGWGTDEDKLIRILCAQQKPQLRRVDEIYGERFGKTLRATCDEELGGFFEGSFKYFMKCAMTADVELDAELLKESMEGWGTDDQLLCELVCTRSNAELRAAKAIFSEAEGKSVEEMVEGDTSGKYESFLLACLQANRDEGPDVDEDRAKEQAARLNQAASSFSDVFCDSDAFIQVLAKSSVKQTAAICAAFEADYGTPFSEFVKEKMSGDWERVLLARVLDKPTYYARVLEGAFKGWGTDEKATARVLGRCTKGAIDRICERYEALYGRTLKEAIESETSGNFKKALLTMIFAESPGIAPDPGFAAEEACEEE